MNNQALRDRLDSIGKALDANHFDQEVVNRLLAEAVQINEAQAKIETTPQPEPVKAKSQTAIQQARAMTAALLPRGERDDRDLALTKEAIARPYERVDAPLDSGQRVSHPITAERLDDYWQRRQAWQNRHWPGGQEQYDAERAALMERVAFHEGYNPNL